MIDMIIRDLHLNNLSLCDRGEENGPDKRTHCHRADGDMDVDVDLFWCNGI